MNFYPDPPPHLDGEDENAFRERLTGADSPYDHARSRECALLDHENCADPLDACMCGCHFQPQPDDKVSWILNIDQEAWQLVNFSIVSRPVYCQIDRAVLADSDERFAAGVFGNALKGLTPELQERGMSAPWIDPKQTVARD